MAAIIPVDLRRPLDFAAIKEEAKMAGWQTRARRGAMAIVVLMTGVVMTGNVWAQRTMYRCNGSGGSTYLSDRPCTAGAGGHLGAIGPVPERYQAPQTSWQPTVPKAPDHLAYLSADCASLNDAIRTGPSRGLRSASLSDLHNEYRSKCAEDEAIAHQRLARDRDDQRNARQQQMAAQDAEQASAKREREQCQELLRILHGKRQRVAQMNDGEKADFERSEANYRARCTAR